MSNVARPSWLPPMVALSGSLPHDLAILHNTFVKDFDQGNPTFLGIPVSWDRKLVTGATYCGAFWHIVSRANPSTQMRELDPSRARRLPWCAAVLANASDSAVKVWDYEKGRGNVRTYAWLEQLDYVVVLEKQQRRLTNVAFLVTAYHLDGDYSRRQLKGLHRRRVI